MRSIARAGSRAAAVLVVALAVMPTAPGWGADWTELFPAGSPDARFGHSMTTVGIDVYVFGGRSVPGVEYNDLWVWDRQQQTWVEVLPSPPLPPVRFAHGAASVIGRLYIGFGLGPGGPLGDIWEYDPGTNSWFEIVIPGPGDHHLGGLAALSNGRLFVAGGYADLGGTIPVTDAWILEPAVPTGTQIASLPAGRVGFAAAAAGDLPMVIGGYLPGDDIFTNEILRWNPNPPPAGAWEVVPPSGDTPLARASAATVQILSEPQESSGWGDTVIILGGEGASKGDRDLVSLDTQMMDVVADAWSFGENMPLGLVSTAGAVLPPLGGGGPQRLEVLVFGGEELQMGGVLAPIDRTFLYLSPVEVVPTLIFQDGLESGDTSAWSATNP